MSTSDTTAPRRFRARVAPAGLLIAGCLGSPGQPEPQPHPVVLGLSVVLPTNIPVNGSWRVVLDTLSIQRAARLTPGDWGALRRLLDRRIELGERCPQDDEARCTTIDLWEATSTDVGVALVVQWSRAARLCGGSSRARFHVAIVSGSSQVVEVSERTYGDCGPPPPE